MEDKESVSSPTESYHRFPSEVGDKPVEAVCPKCRKKVMTEVTKVTGAFAYLMASALTPLLCCCLPFIMTCFKDIIHTCPQCQETLAMRSRSS
ncbi:lipopolysaccharide-induced tumor necrosis factor-alpha factor homolog [Centruroides sculpturatus]|uniref:lipopolysaccharide-induced tumor necrosis factor-alpha factor homolog n=1 Tax=Centruroides sculpturatus TaxID=218467 RepID=UPI000C6CA429|nr:lipopolysaccharide-induced tumor necrosis factor-alpha factor homolog [Centruroides sculpturatus]